MVAAAIALGIGHDVTDSVAAAQSFDVLATPAEQQFL